MGAFLERREARVVRFAPKDYTAKLNPSDADLEAYYQQTRQRHILESDDCPGVFLGITTLKDPESFRNGHHTIEVVSFISYDLFRQWQQTKYQHRPYSYNWLISSQNYNIGLTQSTEFRPPITLKFFIPKIDLGLTLSTIASHEQSGSKQQ